LATSNSEARFNIEVAKELHDFARKKDARSFRKQIAPWPVGYGQSLTYWWNLYTVIDREPCFIFADPRVSHPLTEVGRKFVLSMMNERIRVPDPDFAAARLHVAQFTRTENGKRTIRLFDEDRNLFTFDELNTMIEETYSLWIEILTERSEELRSAPTGTTPLGF
jgi:hypothetical protein